MVTTTVVAIRTAEYERMFSISPSNCIWIYLICWKIWFDKLHFFSRWCHGSPAHRYGLYALQWILEVNGKRTPHLDAFVHVAKVHSCICSLISSCAWTLLFWVPLLSFIADPGNMGSCSINLLFKSHFTPTLSNTTSHLFFLKSPNFLSNLI